MKKINNYQVSTILLLAFTGLILTAGVYSELFRPKRESSSKKTQLLVNPIRKDILANIKEIELKNYSNKFQVKKINSKWKLTSPITMKSSLRNIENIINSLNSVEVKTLLKKDKVNIKNFSLDRPLLTIKIKSQLNEIQEIDFGVINSIDDSTYLIVDDMNAIYQTNIMSSKLIKLKLSDFIDSHIMPTNISNIKKLEIISARDNRTLHVVEKVENNWISNKYKQITNESVDKKLNSMMSLSAKVIVDNPSENTLNFISNYLDNPKLKINVTLKDSKEIRRFLVSYPTNKNEELKIDKRENFIIKDLFENTTYLVDKDFMRYFTIRYSDFK